MSDKPWYQGGLQFNCSQCGDCCTGSPGFVWVNKAEIQQLATLVGSEDVQAFRDQYVRQIGIRYSLKEFPNGDCVFFDTKKRTCQVYDARPRQCRTWPFWDSNLKNADAWKQTCEICPGSGKGQLYQLEEIEDRRTVLRL